MRQPDQGVSLASAVSLVRSHWCQRISQGLMTPASAARYGRVLTSFANFSAALGVHAVDEITSGTCLRFTHAPLPGHASPGTSTARFRLTVVRAAVNHLVDAGIIDADPTVGLRVEQAGSEFRPRPLTPHEVLRLRTAARLRPKDRLRPAAVELALSGLSHAEVAAAVVRDFDQPSGTLTVSGPAARTVRLSERTVSVLGSRVDAMRREARRLRRPLDPSRAALGLHRPRDSYPAESIAPSVSSNLSRALAAAGLRGDGIRPRSLREYAANVAYARHGRVEEVATTLGLGSLDTALSLVDRGWQDAWGDAFRDDQS